jgi:dimeric dUTPase (all-alpha-NTP-PPase superfamily)
LNIDLKEDFSFDVQFDDVVDQFFNIYGLALDFIKTDERETLKKLFISLLYLGNEIGFNEKEIINYCQKKINKDLERVNG